MSAPRVEKRPGKNARVRRALLWDGAHVRGASDEIRAACGKDILFYVNYFCWTFDPRREESCVPFVTYPYQDDAIRAILECVRSGRDVCIGKSRDMGASWLNILVPEYEWHFAESMRNFLMVSRNESYVDDSGNPKSLFWKIDFLHRHQPQWLLPGGGRDGIDRRSMHIGNTVTGSVIDGESTTGEVGRGDRRTAILLDEFAAFDVKSGYNALSATQATTNCRIFNSTPKGTNNAFHDVYRKSSARIITMHWSQHPEKSRGLYASERNEATGRMEVRLLSPWRGVVDVFEKGRKDARRVAFPEDYPFVLDGKKRSPWYDRECSRAVSQVEIAQELDIDFSGSDYQFFDALAVERYRERFCVAPSFVGDVEVDAERQRVVRLTPSAKGCFSLFEELADGRVARGRRFVVGVDVSAGTGASNSAAVVYDMETAEKVAEYANPNILPDDFGRFVFALAQFYNGALVVPDRSGPTGEVFVRRLVALGASVYMRRNEKKVGCPVTDEPGIWLNPAAKTTVLENYRDAIGHCAIVNRSARAMGECLNFIRAQSGCVEHSAEGGVQDPGGARSNHGDLVIADALAYVALKERQGLADMTVADGADAPPEGTPAWRMRFVRDGARDGRREDLGGEWEP